uniref:Similar to n=1 Tax=Bursaphelenchus xylophilus TaxID=6326 RepID=A0A1I7RZA2_BURXY
MPNDIGHYNDSFIGSRSRTNILAHQQENMAPMGDYVDKTIRLKSDVKINLNDVPHSPVDQYEKYGNTVEPKKVEPGDSTQHLGPYSTARSSQSPVSRAESRRRSVPENVISPKSAKDLPPAGPSVCRPRRRSLFATIKDKLHHSHTNLQAQTEQEEPVQGVSQLEKDLGFPPANNSPPLDAFIGSPHSMIVESQFRRRSKSDAVRQRTISINSQRNDPEMDEFSRASTEDECSEMDGDENDNLPMYKHEFRAPSSRRSSAMYFQPPRIRSRRNSEIPDDLHSVSSSTPGRGVMVLFCKSPPNSSTFSPTTRSRANSRANSQHDLDYDGLTPARKNGSDNVAEFDLEDSLADLSLSHELFVDTSLANNSSSSNSFNMTNDAPHTHPVNSTNHGSSPSNIWKRIISRKRAVSACHEQLSTGPVETAPASVLRCSHIIPIF